ncbi:MAG TPA: TPM domain-containing protein, partial [Fibrobacteria bacterium]|nr:TPM domain-containing protein [Fibrobacteria bacterium]
MGPISACPACFPKRTPPRRRSAASLLLAAVLSLFCFLGLAVPAAAKVPVPPLTGRVVDLTGALTHEQADALEQRLRAFEESKGAQVVVLVVPTTRPEEIEQFSIRVAEAWKIGRTKSDDGAILLVALQDRALRIEVGYGLEGALTDLVSKRIVADIVTPHFRAGDIPGGIAAGVDAMLKVIEGEPLPPPERRPDSGAPGAGGGLGQLLPFLILFAFVIGSAARAI